MNGWIIALIIVAVLATGGGIGWSYIAKEHREARSLPLDGVDFSNLKDGVYHGRYEGACTSGGLMNVRSPYKTVKLLL